MKILQVHNQYQQQGGEDAVVQMEMDLLQKKGHEVYQYLVNNDGIKGFVSKVRLALTVHYSKSARENFDQDLQSLQPDIVHVHNFFPMLSPSIFDACYKAGIPVVLTLHNYRLICPGALLMREGKTCELCISGSPYEAVKYSCYRGSRVGSLSVARMVQYHRNHKTWDTKVSQFIALTQFAKQKFVQAGFPEDRMAIKPNFYEEDRFLISGEERQGALFVGRCSKEKGLETLLLAWESINYTLKVVGDGPLMESVMNTENQYVNYLGRKAKEDVLSEMRTAMFLVIPSEWYEGFPMVIVEAFAMGLPVICSQLGGMEEVVDDGVSGIHFQAGNADDLTQKVNWACEHPDEMKQMGLNAKEIYESKYTSQINYEQLMSIYSRVSEGYLSKC